MCGQSKRRKSERVIQRSVDQDYVRRIFERRKILDQGIALYISQLAKPPDGRGDGQYPYPGIDADQDIRKRPTILYDMKQIMANLSAKTRCNATFRSLVKNKDILTLPSETRSDVRDERTLSNARAPRCKSDDPQFFAGEHTTQARSLVCIQISHDARPRPQLPEHWPSSTPAPGHRADEGRMAEDP